MQIPSMQRRNLAFLAALIILLYTVLQLRQISTDVPGTFDRLDDVVPAPVDIDQSLRSDDAGRPVLDAPLQVKPPRIQPPVIPPACANVDFAWLASERTYWDGWASKAMFMKPDGNFTLKNVFINEGDSVCVIVLLGPIPAKSAIRPEEHLGPADSTVLTAVGKWTRISIDLQQHPKQTNVYYAAVQFAHEDVYQLEARTEYRSYFWEIPILHDYRPYSFLSDNKLVVRANSEQPRPTLPACDATIPGHNEGAWMAKSEYQRVYPLDFYGMFGAAQEDHAENNQLFVPNLCRPQYISLGQAAQCLNGKTVHVWADNNVKRNLKAFSSGNRWCNDHTASECICKDDDEDPEHKLYPWAVDPTVPLTINKTWHAETDIYFKHVGSIVLRDWRQDMKQQAAKLPQADIVILGFGNEDIRERAVSPLHFADAFLDLLNYIAHTVYPTQRIIVRTPQPFCCGTIKGTSWNAGRSAAFTRAVKDGVERLADMKDRIFLWDVHRLGLPENMCVNAGTAYTKRNVINIENLLLWNLVCDMSFSPV